MDPQSRPKYFHVSWEEMHRDSRALAWKLLNFRKDWKGAIAITRGGMVPTGIVSRELNIRLVDTICIASYDEEHQGEINVLKGVQGDGEGMVLIDDLVDTGKTARVVREMLPKAHFATVYAKPAGKELVDTFITEVSQDTWIRFPWDLDLNFAPPLWERG